MIPTTWDAAVIGAGPAGTTVSAFLARRGFRVVLLEKERFYRPGWAMNTFFLQDKPPELVQQLNTMLAGDVWRDDNPWQNRLLATKRRTVSLAELSSNGEEE